MSDEKQPRDVIAEWLDTLDQYDQTYRIVDRVVMALYKAGYEITKITSTEALLNEMALSESAVDSTYRAYQRVEAELAALAAEVATLRTALAETHPEHQWAWVDGNYHDMVVIHREWQAYQRAAAVPTDRARCICVRGSDGPDESCP